MVQVSGKKPIGMRDYEKINSTGLIECRKGRKEMIFHTLVIYWLLN